MIRTPRLTWESGASLQKLPNSEILSYLEIGRHLGVFDITEGGFLTELGKKSYLILR